MESPFPHEKECVEFHPAAPRSYAALWQHLLDAGFCCQEGESPVWFLKRQEFAPNGQSESYGTVGIFFDGKELFLEEDEAKDNGENPRWDKLEITYLLATLPEAKIEPFVERINALSEELQLPVMYKNEQITALELQNTFHQFARFLDEEFGGAGSQTIVHFIDIHYS